MENQSLTDLSDEDCDFDEEEVIKNYDEEAHLIVQEDTLPKKSTNRYMQVYNAYKKWKAENLKSLSVNEENNLLVYFKKLLETVKPSTLWSVWSMLRKTLGTRDNINISNFLSLNSYIKNTNKGYKPQRALVLRWHHIMQYMTEASDFTDLSKKVNNLQYFLK